MRLKERISELHTEIDQAKEDFRHLHRQRGVLSKERENQIRETEVWRARCRDLQMLKFGREIDLDELEASSDRSREVEAEMQLQGDAEAFRHKAMKLLKEKVKLEEQLTMVHAQYVSSYNTIVISTACILDPLINVFNTSPHQINSYNIISYHII